MRALLIVLAVLVTVGGPSAAVNALGDADDAGSGRDAPDSFSGAILVEPEVAYEGHLDGDVLADLVGAPDVRDFYAFSARAGDIIHAHVSRPDACIALYRPDGHLAVGCATTRTLTSTINADGIWFLGIASPGPGAYRFSFDFAGGRLPSDDRAALQDDAGSGTDAPDRPRDLVRIVAGVIYRGDVSGFLAGPDSADFFAYAGVAGERITVEVIGVEVCARFFSPQGAPDSGSVTCGVDRVESRVLDADGVWFVEIGSVVPTAYTFIVSSSFNA